MAKTGRLDLFFQRGLKVKTPRLLTLFLLAVSLVAASLPVELAAAKKLRVNRTAALFKEFDDRVQNYVKLQKQKESALPALKNTSDPAEIEARRKTLAAAIQAARRHAVPGDIFFSAVKPEFLKILRGELKGPGSRTTRAAIQEDKPNQIALRVNRVYPETAPLSTVPPMVLLNLPPLPEQLEYRFVNRHLVLRDAKANLIVDYMALPRVQI